MLTAYQSLLVAVDGSPASLHALEEALRLTPARLVAAAVAPPIESTARGRHKLPAFSLEAAGGILEKAAALARDRGVDLETAPLGGEPHVRLVELAKERGCDLMVMGRKGTARQDKALMGSTVARVIGFAPLDVLVVPLAGTVDLGRVLCPVDGSRFSKAALDRAIALVREQRGELLAFAVLDAPPGFVHEMPQVARDLLAGLEKLVHEAARKAAAQGVPCRTAVGEGSAYRAIVEVAHREQAGLIVMGSHGRTGLKRLLMGSVTERVIGYADRPVLVVKVKRHAH